MINCSMTDIRPLDSDGMLRIANDMYRNGFQSTFPLVLHDFTNTSDASYVREGNDLRPPQGTALTLVDGQHRLHAAIHCVVKLSKDMPVKARIIFGEISQNDLAMYAIKQNKSAQMAIKDSIHARMYTLLSGINKMNVAWSKEPSDSIEFKTRLFIPVQLRNELGYDNPPPAKGVGPAVGAFFFLAALQKISPDLFGGLVAGSQGQDFSGFASSKERTDAYHSLKKEESSSSALQNWRESNKSWLTQVIVWYTFVCDLSPAAFELWGSLTKESSQYSNTFSFRDFVVDLSIRHIGKWNFCKAFGDDDIASISQEMFEFAKTIDFTVQQNTLDPQCALFTAVCMVSKSCTAASGSSTSKKRRRDDTSSEVTYLDPETQVVAMQKITKTEPRSNNLADPSLSEYLCVLYELRYRFFTFAYLKRLKEKVIGVAEKLGVSGELIIQISKAFHVVLRNVIDAVANGSVLAPNERASRRFGSLGYGLFEDKKKKIPDALALVTTADVAVEDLLSGCVLQIIDTSHGEFDALKRVLVLVQNAFVVYERQEQDRAREKIRLQRLEEERVERERKCAEQAARDAMKERKKKEKEDKREKLRVDLEKKRADALMNIHQDSQVIPNDQSIVPSDSSEIDVEGDDYAGSGDQDMEGADCDASGEAQSSGNVSYELPLSAQASFEQRRQISEKLLATQLLKTIVSYPLPFSYVTNSEQNQLTSTSRQIDEVIELVNSFEVLDLGSFPFSEWLKRRSPKTPYPSNGLKFKDVKLTVVNKIAIVEYLLLLKDIIRRQGTLGTFAMKDELRNTVSFILTDPPFNILDSGHDRISESEYKQFAAACSHVLKGCDPNRPVASDVNVGSCFVFCTAKDFGQNVNIFEETHKLKAQMSPYTLIKSQFSTNLRTANLINVQQQAIILQPINARGKAEKCYLAPASSQSLISAGVWSNQSKFPNYTNVLHVQDVTAPAGNKLLLNMFTVPQKGLFRAYARAHQEKSLEPLCELIRQRSVQSDLVIDFFSGTGTVALAALIMGRNAVLFESDPLVWVAALDRMFCVLNALQDAWSHPLLFQHDNNTGISMTDADKRDFYVEMLTRVNESCRKRNRFGRSDTIVDSVDGLEWNLESRRGKRVVHERPESEEERIDDDDDLNAEDSYEDQESSASIIVSEEVGKYLQNTTNPLQSVCFFDSSLNLKENPPENVVRESELGACVSASNRKFFEESTFDVGLKNSDLFEVKKSSLPGLDSGMGLFSKVPLRKGTSVGYGFYGTWCVGIKSVPDSSLSDAISTSVRLRTKAHTLVFIAPDKGCLTRYANGSSPNCDSSLCNSEYVEDPSWMSSRTDDEFLAAFRHPEFIRLVLRKDIGAGVEIIVDYGPTYDWSQVQI